MKILGSHNDNNDFDSYKDYIINIIGLPKNFSTNCLIANIRTYGLKEGARRTSSLSKVKMCDSCGKESPYIPDCFNRTKKVSTAR